MSEYNSGYSSAFARAYHSRWTWFAKAVAPQALTVFKSRFGTERGLDVLDLGCGTGTFANELARYGHRVVGLDASEGMLGIARAEAAKNTSTSGTVDFRRADIRQFNVNARFDVIASLFDTLNHLDAAGLELCLDELLACCHEKTMLFCDLVTTKGLLRWNTSMVDDTDGVFLYNRGIHAAGTNCAHILISGFVRGDGLEYERFDEYHVTNAFPLDTIKEMLAMRGWQSIEYSKLGAIGSPVADPESLDRVVLLASREKR